MKQVKAITIYACLAIGLGTASAGEEKVKKVDVQVKLDKGGMKTGFLGVYLIEITPELRQHFGAPKDAGVLIAKIVEDSPALSAGIKTGDVLVSIDGKNVDSAMAIGSLVGPKKDGEKAKILLMRDKRKKTVTATIVVRKKPMIEITECIKHKGKKECMQHLELKELAEHLKHLEHLKMLPKDMHLPDLEHRLESLMKKEQFIEQMKENLEEKMKKVEERLKKLEKKIQGDLTRRLKRKSA